MRCIHLQKGLGRQEGSATRLLSTDKRKPVGKELP